MYLHLFACVCVCVGCITSGLSLEEQSEVVEVMVASIRQAAEGAVLPGRNSGKKVREMERMRTSTSLDGLSH